MSLETDAKRLERIELLEEQVKLYDELDSRGLLTRSDMTKYLNILKQLGKLKEIEKNRHDIMSFATKYFNNGRLMKPSTPSPPFHHDLAHMIERELSDSKNSSYLAVVAPRSHAKTVFGIVITTLWAICYEIHPYFVIISNRQEGAKQILAMVKYELMNNDDLIKDFGDLYNKQAWSMMEIITANNIKVQAAGSGDALRGSNHLGSRPWVLMDDIEKDPEVLSADYRDKMQDWFNQTVVPLGSPEDGGTKIIWVGTILHQDSVLNRVMKKDTRFKTKRYAAVTKFPERMDLWDEWREILLDRDFTDADNSDDAAKIAGEKAREFYNDHVEEMNQGAEVLWPERMSLYNLMIIWAENRKAFLTEYSGDPRDETTILFNNFTYFDMPEIGSMEDLEIVGAVDPSLGKNHKSDMSAIVTIGKHKRTGIMYVLEVDAKRRSPDKIIEDILVKAQIYKYRAFGVETVQFQHLFMTDLRKRSAAEGVYLPIKEMRPSQDKWLRIASLEPLIQNGFIRFMKQHRELIEELGEFGTDGSLPKHDDRADALEMAVSLVKKGKRTIAIGSLS